MARSSPHFFKVYFPQLSSDHLKIPPAFRGYIEHELPGTVSLKGPSGGTWNVEFVKSSKGLLFANGWNKFVADHSIELGDFLVFRYDGGLHFSVLVFDATACEKEAAFLARPYGGGHITIVGGIVGGVEGETMGEHDSKALILSPNESFGVGHMRNMCSIDCLAIQAPPSKTEKKKKGSPSDEVAAISQADLDSWKLRKSKSKTPARISPPSGALAVPHKKVHENTMREDMHKKKIVSSGHTIAVSKAKTKLQRGRPLLVQDFANVLNFWVPAAKTSALSVTSTAKSLIVAKVQRMPSLISQRRLVTKEEINKALEQAKSFKSKSPFVRVVMRDSYVYVSFFMNIPYPFVREHLPKISKKMTLWDPNGKPWAVNYVSYSSRGGFSAGWAQVSIRNFNSYFADFAGHGPVQEGSHITMLSGDRFYLLFIFQQFMRNQFLKGKGEAMHDGLNKRWASGALDPERTASHDSVTSVKRVLIRPHPAVWRLVHGMAVVYLVALTFLLFQNRDDARQFMKYLHPDLGVELPERSYGSDCRIYVPENPKSRFNNVYETLFDEFVLAHIFGWWGKAIMIRNQPLLWVLSVGFELMELTFRHMLPNFNECWWDSIILDILICNWFGENPVLTL
ncbi:putative B3 domain-containing protein [Cocos nucifera]|uniref:CDP-diacylglycerol--serine O-phosphatidyltransferase n=1 Tax=Cocos nucifera TaxID=13894 RepID=A0A8K0N2U8_COCNU|nr:putative B3 domain-containing protein [Cocos nucifera]